MRNLAIARRYAKALLLIGKEDGQTETYRKELERIANLFAGEKELEQAVCNPLYRFEQRQKVLKKIIEALQVSRIMSAFIGLLFEKRRIVYLAQINEFYQKLADQLNGIERASLISAIRLSSEAVDNIRQSLNKMTGKQIILEQELDSSLIGGVVTKIGDLVLDGSVKTQLINLRESLKRGERV